MADTIYDAFREIVFHKAERLDKQGREQARKLLKELKIDDIVNAFILGSIDAMIFDVAYSTAFRTYANRVQRAKLVEEYWTSKH